MFPVAGSDCVCVDRFSGVYNAVQYLHSKGRRRILFIETIGAKQRKEGYLQAVRDLGLPELIMQATSRNLEEIRKSGIDAAREIAGMSERPDAIQTSDYLACGMLPEFIRLGIRVPEDIAVIGFDDREIAAMSTPPLTTIAHPGEEVGAACAKMIIDRIEGGFSGGSEPECVKISMKLVIRQSV
jgi:LacI family transcriptional regulator